MHKVLMPKLGMAQSWCLIEKWHKKEGDEVKRGDLILEVSTDKISYEVEAKENGYILKILKLEDEEVPVGETIAFIGEKGELKSLNSQIENKEEKIFEKDMDLEDSNKIISNVEMSKIKISALAKKLAEINNIDISKIKATGPQGRISTEDVENYITEHRLK